MKDVPTLPGYKTYILGTVLVAKGLAGLFFPEHNVSDNPGMDIQMGLMAIFVRAGIAKAS
ncbi:MAG: hypothetical protein ACR2PS_01130 [Pseudomonadales bacterium]